jgi:hypothetical protein
MPHMHSKFRPLRLRLPSETAAALSKTARRLQRPQTTLVLAAIAQYLQEADDRRAIISFRKRPRQTVSLEQVRQRLGLIKD